MSGPRPMAPASATSTHPRPPALPPAAAAAATSRGMPRPMATASQQPTTALALAALMGVPTQAAAAAAVHNQRREAPLPAGNAFSSRHPALPSTAPGQAAPSPFLSASVRQGAPALVPAPALVVTLPAAIPPTAPGQAAPSLFLSASVRQGAPAFPSQTAVLLPGMPPAHIRAATDPRPAQRGATPSTNPGHAPSVPTAGMPPVHGSVVHGSAFDSSVRVVPRSFVGTPAASQRGNIDATAPGHAPRVPSASSPNRTVIITPAPATPAPVVLVGTTGTLGGRRVTHTPATPPARDTSPSHNTPRKLSSIIWTTFIVGLTILAGLGLFFLFLL